MSHSVRGGGRLPFWSWLAAGWAYFGAADVDARLLPKVTARTVVTDSVRPPGLPTDAQLESAGARVGAIHFVKRQLFDAGSGDEDAALFDIANRLHVQTREATLSDQLLFKTGDIYQGRLLAESARILRSTRYLRDAQIRPVTYQNGVVDVEVVSQDVWTLNPGISFGRQGGKNSSGFKLEELNVFGLGTQLGVGYKSSVDRDSKTIFYRDKQLGSSWWDLSARYSDNSDGRLASLALERPFYALNVRWAAGVMLGDDRRIDSRYDLGQIVDQFETQQRQATIYAGFSSGLRAGRTLRWRVGASFDDATYAATTGAMPTRLLPQSRRWVYPWAEAEWLGDEFVTERNRDQIEKTEDISLGWHVRTRLGIAGPALGADRTAILWTLAASKGRLISARQTLLAEWSATGRIEKGKVIGSLTSFESRYYFRQSPRRLLFATLNAQWGLNLDASQQILLGGDNGLRGYPLRYQSGTGRWLLTAEQRFFTNWYPFQLVNVGGAVFYDMGKSWGRDPLGASSRGLLKDIGFGLRLGNSRSALGNVLHIDVALPLDRGAGIKSLQFLVETKRRF